MTDRIGELLVRENLISLAQLRRALADQRTTGKRLSYSLARLGILDEPDLAAFLSQQYGVPLVRLSDYEIDPEVIALVPQAVASKHTAIPLQRGGSTLLVAMADPSNIYAIDDLKVSTDLNVEPVVSTESAIEAAIVRHYGESAATSATRLPISPTPGSERDTGPLGLEIPEPDQTIHLCNRLLLSACHRGATQVHLEPSARGLRIRARIDGVLQPEAELPVDVRSAVLTRFKVMAGLDIADRRGPQQGLIRGFHASTDQALDIRVTTLPTATGERMVLRLHHRSSLARNLGGLGLDAEQLRQARAALQQPHGLIVVAGPTGSGVTTTLYAALGELTSDYLSIGTVEDPVEFVVPGCTQVQVQRDGGMTTAAAIQALLQQDPDVIMVGAMPDYDSVAAVVRGAASGRRVLTSIPASDTATALVSLMHLGIEPFMVASTVTLVIAQRLPRRLCSECAVDDPEATPARLTAAGLNPQIARTCRPKRAHGCKVCVTGYRGRVPLFEVLPMHHILRERLGAGTDVANLRAESTALGCRSLRQVGLERVAAGILSLDDLLRVTGGEDLG